MESQEKLREVLPVGNRMWATFFFFFFKCVSIFSPQFFSPQNHNRFKFLEIKKNLNRGLKISRKKKSLSGRQRATGRWNVTSLQELMRETQNFRIHVSAGQLVGVFDETLLLHIHQEALSAHGTDVVRQAPAGHPSPAVVLHTHWFRLSLTSVVPAAEDDHRTTCKVKET